MRMEQVILQVDHRNKSIATMLRQIRSRDLVVCTFATEAARGPCAPCFIGLHAGAVTLDSEMKAMPAVLQLREYHKTFTYKRVAGRGWHVGDG